jgi:hypothetical protein
MRKQILKLVLLTGVVSSSHSFVFCQWMNFLLKKQSISTPRALINHRDSVQQHSNMLFVRNKIYNDRTQQIMTSFFLVCNQIKFIIAKKMQA